MNNELKVRIIENYSADPKDFQLGNEELDSFFKKHELTRINLLKKDSVIGYILVTFCSPNSPFVRFVFIFPEFRGDKYSVQLYIEANKYCKNKYGKNLSSDQFNFIKRSATKIWESLVDQGLAIKLPNQFEMI